MQKSKVIRDREDETRYKSSLVGANLDRMNFKGMDFHGVDMSGASLRGADLRDTNLQDAKMIRCDLSGASMRMADLSRADISGSDLTGAFLKATLFYKTIAWRCLFRRITAKNCLFLYTDLRESDFFQAELLGARFDGALTEGVRNMDTAQFFWWASPWEGSHSYKPRPGWKRMDQSVFGGTSVQENAGSQAE